MIPALSPKTLRAMRSTRFVISDAARRENVISRIRRGSAPWTIKWATRWARVLVLPEPAPAMTSSGAAANPPAAPCSTARRCSGLRVSRYAVAGCTMGVHFFSELVTVDDSRRDRNLHLRLGMAWLPGKLQQGGGRTPSGLGAFATPQPAGEIDVARRLAAGALDLQPREAAVDGLVDGRRWIDRFAIGPHSLIPAFAEQRVSLLQHRLGLGPHFGRLHCQ